DLKLKLQHSQSTGSMTGGSSMMRHSSFDEFCKVVERERNLLIESTSEPTSPVKKLNFDDTQEDKAHKFAMPVTITKHLSFDEQMMRNVQPSHPRAVHNFPEKIIHKPRAMPAVAQAKNIILCTPTPGTKPTETIILSKSGEVKSISNHGTSQQIPLSRSQFQQVLQSLKIAKSHAHRQISFNKPPEEEAMGNTILGQSLLQSPEYNMAVLNETSPMPGTTFLNRTLKRNMVEVNIPNDKRIKLEAPTPPSGTVSDEPEAGLTPTLVSHDLKIGLRRLNSMPITHSGTTPSPTARYMPQIIVHRINRPQTNQRITVQLGSDLSGSTKCATVLSSGTAAMLNGGSNKIVIDNLSLTPGTSFSTQPRTLTSTPR
ncbi:unnamed protein product, partial [Lymnaea stagnalis]